MTLPLLPTPVTGDLTSTIASEDSTLEGIAGNINQAQQQAALISAYRIAAPHLPAAAYISMAQTGIDPSSPEFAGLVKSYTPSPDSNTIGYVNGQVGSQPTTKTSNGHDPLVTAINPDGSLRFANAGEQGVALDKLPPNVTSGVPAAARKQWSAQLLKRVGLPGGDSNPLADAFGAIENSPVGHFAGSAASDLWNADVSAIKGTVRWASGALYYPIEAGNNVVTHELNATLGDAPKGLAGANDGNLTDMLWRGTQFGQAVTHGGGSGWLLRPGGSGKAAEAEQEKIQNIQQGVRGYFIDPNSGQRITATVGRDAAAGLGGAAGDLGLSGVAHALQPQRLTTSSDSLIFNLVSGAADAFANLKLDPGKLANEGFAALRGAHQGIDLGDEGANAARDLLSGKLQDNSTFRLGQQYLADHPNFAAQAAGPVDTVATALGATSPLKRAMGMVNSMSQWVHRPTWDQFADSSRGQRLWAALANTDSLGELHDRTFGQWAAMPGFSQAIVDAKTPEEARAVFDQAVHAGDITELPHVGLNGLGGARYAITQPLRDKRIFNMMPGMAFNPNDSAQFITNTDRYARNALLDDATRHDLIAQAIDVMNANPVARPNALHNFYANLGNAVYRKIVGSGWWEGRQASQTISGMLDAAKENPADLRSFVEDTMTNTFPHATLTPEQIDGLTNIVADAARGETYGHDTPAAMVANTLQNVLPDLGKQYQPDAIAWSLSRYKSDSTAEARQLLTDQEHPGAAEVLPVVNPDGTTTVHAMDGPTMYGQLHHGEEAFVDPRLLRRTITGFHNVMFGANPFERINEAGDGVDTRTWLNALDAVTRMYRTATILGPRLALRILANNAAGYALGNQTDYGANPMRMLAGIIGSHSTDAQDLADAGAIDLNGAKWADQREATGRIMSAAQGVDKYGNVRSDLAFARQIGHITADDRRAFPNAWAWNLAQFNSDPVAREVARTMLADDPQAAAADLWHSYSAGTLSQYRREFAAAGGWRENLLQPEGARAYLNVLQRQIDATTGGRPDLLQAIADGKWGDGALGDGKNANPDLVQHLADLRDQEIGPRDLMGPKSVAVSTGSGSKATRAIGHAVDTLFTHVVNAPVQAFNDHIYGEFYREGLNRLLPNLDDTERAKVMDALLTGEKQDYASEAFGTGHMTAQEADLAAKVYATQKLKSMTLDLYDRSQFGDIIRLLSPFADHWRQLVVKWAHLGFDNFPLAAERLRQLNSFATNQGTREWDGKQWTENNGWFFNDQYGGLNFHIPLSGMAISALTGDKMADLTAPASGLSLATQGMPGLGGVLTVPASMVLSKIPGAQELQQRLMPYGAPDTSHGILEAFAPGWMQRFLTAAREPDGQRDWAQQLAQSTAYLQSTNPGKYTNDAKGRTALYNDAESLTRKLYIMRGIAQFALPAAPHINQSVKTATSGDKGVEAWRIAQDYQSMLTDAYAKGGTTADAVAEFVKRYGPNDAMLLTPETGTTIYGLASTQKQYEWGQAHPDIVAAYPKVWPLFAPNANDPQDKNFDYGQYQRQIGDNERTVLPWDQRQQLADYRIGSMLYDAARSRLGANPSPNQKAWLQLVKTAIGNDYPGYAQIEANSGVLPGPQKETGDYLVNDVATMANEPSMADNPVAQAVRLYMEARQKAMDALNTRNEPQGAIPGTILNDQNAAPLRAWLRGIGAQLVHAVPQFAPTWESVFSYEVGRQ